MENELNPLDYWRILLKGKWLIFYSTLVASLLSIVISLQWPKTYRAEAVIMVLGGQKGGGIAQTMAQVGLLLPGFVGGNSTSSAQTLAILRSRTLSENVIEKNDLMPALFPDEWDAGAGRWTTKESPNMEEAVRKLGKLVHFTEDKKNQTIVISAVTRDPKQTAFLANGFVKELSEHIQRNTFTAAKKNRIFIEGQLERNKADLLKAGKELTSFYSTNRISNAIPTVDVDTAMDEQARSESLEDLQKDLIAVDEKIKKAKIVRDVPEQVYLQYVTLRQELLGKTNALLTHQYELAKIEENKEELAFQIIDEARIPFRKFKPKRAQIVVTTFVVSLFLSAFYVLFRDYLQKLKASHPKA